MDLIDIRCDGVRTSGPKRGVPCNYLLLRITEETTGVIETKCPRCNQVRQWTLHVVPTWGFTA